MSTVVPLAVYLLLWTVPSPGLLTLAASESISTSALTTTVTPNFGVLPGAGLKLAEIHLPVPPEF